MNNAQFRKLLETPRPAGPATSTNAGPSATPVLGSRQRPSIPMTPRSLTAGNNDFARQLAAHRAAQQPTKKFRSSAAPKGTKLAAGYVDRAKARSEEEVEDERARRLEALETLYKEGQIEHEEYLRQTKLLGGDVSSTHLVKGLDFALLERVRKGEDVMNAAEKEEDTEEALEDKLDEVLEKDVAPVERKKEKKKGVAAPKTRAEILAELRKQRQEAKAAANPSLGSKFRKIGEPRPKEKEPEPEEKVKHVLGEDGRVKKKVKRSDKERRQKSDMPPPSSAPLGMMPPPPLPGAKKVEPEEEEDNDDIFDGVGDYDPLADLRDDSSDEEASSKPQSADAPKEKEESGPPTDTSKAGEQAASPPTTAPTSSMPPPPLPRPKPKLFDDDADVMEEDTGYKPPSSASSLLASDPSLAAALAKAAKIAAPKSQEEEEKEKRRKAMQEGHDRDAYDIDFGFGGSRDFGDEDDDEYVEGKKGSGSKRKRGPKKKKAGDKNSAEVIGKVVEERYGKGKA